MLKQLVFASALFQATFISRTAGHGNIYDPKPEGTGGDYKFYFGGPAGSLDMPELVGKSNYGEYYKGVNAWFTKNNVDSLKDFVTTYMPDVAECGNTKKNGTPQPVPSDGYVKHDTLGSSHPGPCEIWCDNTRVFHDVNCAGKFAGQVPTKIPIDVSTCKSSSELVFYWLALHAQPWQIYINCVALDGATAGGSNSTSTKKTKTKIKTTKAPVSKAKETSVAGEADEEETTEAPIADQVATVAPYQEDPITTPPSTSSSKCLRRRS